MYFTRHMNSKYQIIFCEIKTELNLFQALEIVFILQIKVDTHDKKIFVDKIWYKKIKYRIF